MDVVRAVNILKQIGRALSAAHDKGILHRDLKPENIMLQNLDHEEHVKIIDFGIAKVKDSVIAPSTSADLSPGTVAYMAPEQLSGRPITSATDIFALGAIAYEMITGRKPFNPESKYQLLELQQSGVRVRPSDLRPVLPHAGQQAILKALEFNPNDRYKIAREFTDDLAAAFSNDGRADEPLRNEVPAAQPATYVVNDPPPARFRQEKTIQVPFVAASNHVASNSLVEPTRSSRRRMLLATMLVMAFASLLAGGLITIRWIANSRNKTEPTSPKTERTLTYGLTVQKMRNGRPYQDPFPSSGQEIFEDGWKFRMNISSPQSGCLYLLNEGPAAQGKITYNVLFPAPSTNSGSPYLEAEQKIQTGWMVFVEQHGIEKFWMVWAAEAVPELEAVKEAVNEKDKGEIRDESQARDVREFLAKNSSTRPIVETDKEKKQTTARTAGPILVNLIELEHH